LDCLWRDVVLFGDSFYGTCRINVVILTTFSIIFFFICNTRSALSFFHQLIFLPNHQLELIIGQIAPSQLVSNHPEHGTLNCQW